METIQPVFFILIISVIAVEAWWFWFEFPSQQYITLFDFILLEIVTFCCLLLTFFSFAGIFAKKFVFFAAFIPLVFYAGFYKFRQFFEKRYEQSRLRMEIEKVLNSASRFSNGSGFEKAGDIYFSRSDFENALIWYQKARVIKETPEILHKINSTKQEILLKKKKIWICPECSATNSRNNKRCKSCGALMPSAGIKYEFYKSIPELKKNLLLAVIAIVIISTFVWFIKNAGLLTSIIFYGVLFVISGLYLMYKIFSR
ncbi:MAG: zinc finger Ran-binding domain-containing protein [Candidatus Omnitrophica bacterium]|nr:zinc finger Ran-binding domain-containing protein [Candidatus Omnitrophota bacterium]MCM8825221.1 zinc finger Ran-binding domain-containing protein [Candidatus Omnitrophota bacterium]